MSEQEQPVIERRVNWASRIGCFAGVFIWSLIMLIPGFFCAIAFQGELALWYGDSMPDSAEHPVIQVKLISEIEASGFIITNSYITGGDDTATCVQSNITYLLWNGDGENAQYCQCYERESVEENWVYQQTILGTCQ